MKKRGKPEASWGITALAKAHCCGFWQARFRRRPGKIFLKGRVGAIMTMGSGFKQDFTGRENVFCAGCAHGYPQRPGGGTKWNRSGNLPGLVFSLINRCAPISSGMLARLAFCSVYQYGAGYSDCGTRPLMWGDADFKRKCLDHVSALVEKGMALLLVSHSPLIVEQFLSDGKRF